MEKEIFDYFLTTKHANRTIYEGYIKLGYLEDLTVKKLLTACGANENLEYNVYFGSDGKFVCIVYGEGEKFYG